MTKWNKQKDKLLLELFSKSISGGGVSSTDIGKEAIKEVIRKFFPEREYNSFAPLFRANSI